MKNLFIVVVIALLIFIVVFLLPLKEIKSFLDFKLFPSGAKLRYFKKLVNKKNQTVYLLGTAHYMHIANKDYSFWHIKAVIKSLSPDLLLVEIRDSALSKGRWGEGPIEMPFAALVAKNNKIIVHGMDDWSDQFTIRENNMVKNSLDKIDVSKKTLILTGFSHISGFLKRFEKSGFQEQHFSSKNKKSIFKKTVNKKFPLKLSEELNKMIHLVKEGQTRYNDNWAKKRKLFIKLINKLD
ncbi:MAG: hypothetical protein COB02_10760 [Candidatus Cloacimonadota bacterium]|nr:MAG: hypothetical protein COB02_10760 [Candidatus Cloacimonadota bacterium]